MWPTATGVLASATGVVVNLATELKTSWWAWAVVALLTAVGVLVALLAQPAERPGREPEREQEPPAPRGAVHNSVSSPVYGTVVQAGTIGAYHENRPLTVNQNAVARDGGTVHQAGRDLRHDPGA
ncbi:hypothetical protein GCM10010185_20620 [Saccharothrix coeruleofusca]|uniref:Uncharacterized protein n=1 Tax=Saccharothrix coeruleofusca TaxID=33919 RepID=A0A918ECE8_9PSEU|nr:hypothetical protein GCM10010185_20620 [Saccharothrix coeruleofusca]